MSCLDLFPVLTNLLQDLLPVFFVTYMCFFPLQVESFDAFGLLVVQVIDHSSILKLVGNLGIKNAILSIATVCK